jgi:uncharacterized protein
MSIAGENVLLRAFMLSTDRVHFSPAFERLVRSARKLHMAGATVLRGIHGFGSRGINPPPGLHLATPEPVIVEIVDHAEKIAAFVREEIVGGVGRAGGVGLTHGTITLERAAVMLYRHRASTTAKAPLELLGRVKDLSTVPDIEADLHGSAVMKTNEDGILLRVFAGESDTVGGRPLYEAVVKKARELGLAGATVLRGSMGFGANSVLHTTKIVELSTDLPIVIELVDSEEKIRMLLPALDGMVQEGMITMEAVRVVAYRHNPADTRA